MSSKSFNSSEIPNNTVALASIHSTTSENAAFVGVLPGMDELSGRIFSFARITYSWDSVTGGSTPLIVAAHILTPDNPTLPAVGTALRPLWTRIGSVAVAYVTVGSTSLGCVGAPPANGSEYCDIISLAGSSTTPLAPLPSWWSIRFWTTGGTAFTGGTLTVQSVTLYE